MKVLLPVLLVAFALWSGVVHAQSPNPDYLPLKHKVRHGKPLFKYPSDKLVYIVTYTQEDLQRMKRDQFVRNFEHQSNTGSDDLIR